MKSPKLKIRVGLFAAVVLLCAFVVLNRKHASYKGEVIRAIRMSVANSNEFEEIDIYITDALVYTQVDVAVFYKNQTKKYAKYIYVCGEIIGSDDGKNEDPAFYRLLDSVYSGYFDKRPDYGLRIRRLSGQSIEATWLPGRPGGFTYYELDEKGNVEIQNGA